MSVKVERARHDERSVHAVFVDLRGHRFRASGPGPGSKSLPGIASRNCQHRFGLFARLSHRGSELPGSSDISDRFVGVLWRDHDARARDRRGLDSGGYLGGRSIVIARRSGPYCARRGLIISSYCASVREPTTLATRVPFLSIRKVVGIELTLPYLYIRSYEP